MDIFPQEFFSYCHIHDGIWTFHLQNFFHIHTYSIIIIIIIITILIIIIMVVSAAIFIVQCLVFK